jgi:N-acetylglucosamine-6-phosphate deacetylase
MSQHHSTLNLINAHVPGYSGLQQILIEQGTIAQILPMDTAWEQDPDLEWRVLDANRDWLSLGGIDLQINGALGLPFPELTVENSSQLSSICQFLWNQGVDGFLPTLVTTSLENIQRSLSCLATILSGKTEHGSALPSTLQQPTSNILGVHLEGPFLNPQKRGAHPEEYLLPLTLDNVKRVLGDYASIVKIMTLAPELDVTGTVIPYLRSLGIIVSLGHSLATAAQAQQAFDQGATMVTHVCNAMPGLHHREPGLLGAAMVHPGVYCGLIADGQHVSPIMMQILLRAAQGNGGIFLVSDALSPLGLPDGIYPWDTRQITVTQGTARLPNGTLAGTTLGLLAGVQNLTAWSVCAIEQAIELATLTPRQAITMGGGYSQRHCPYHKQPAHLIRWHQTTSGEWIWQRLSDSDPSLQKFLFG